MQIERLKQLSDSLLTERMRLQGVVEQLNGQHHGELNTHLEASNEVWIISV